MTENDVKRLNRSELLQLLIEQTKRNEDLEAELAKANKQLDDRAIMVNEAGSIAEASLKLNDVFGSAQAAAEQLRSQLKGYIDEANRAQSEASELKRELFRLQQRLDSRNNNNNGGNRK